jgi:hypothetical protein
MQPFTRDLDTVVGCHPRTTTVAASVSSTGSANVKFRGGPAVRREGRQGRLSAAGVIRRAKSNGCMQSSAAVRPAAIAVRLERQLSFCFATTKAKG